MSLVISVRMFPGETSETETPLRARWRRSDNEEAANAVLRR